MLVDDDDSLRTLLRVTLPKDGFEIVEARDGQEALDLLASAVPDVVVLDWKMPERSGEEVLADVKRRHPALPVIVLTAEIESRHRSVAESLGADEFLTKPFSPLQLLGAIERLTDRAPG
jgi:two-component system OmpR family response regulator